MSSLVRTPPPTVSGMNTVSAVRRDDVEEDRPLLERGGDVEERELVRPFVVVAAAISTGSPASRRPTKLTPLTTRPSFTSRQGMIRRVSI